MSSPPINWGSLWKIRMHEWLKFLLWKIVWDILPTRGTLMLTLSVLTAGLPDLPRSLGGLLLLLVTPSLFSGICPGLQLARLLGMITLWPIQLRPGPLPSLIWARSLPPSSSTVAYGNSMVQNLPESFCLFLGLSATTV